MLSFGELRRINEANSNLFDRMHFWRSPRRLGAGLRQPSCRRSWSKAPANDAEGSPEEETIDTDARLTDVDGAPTRPQGGRRGDGDIGGSAVSGPVAGEIVCPEPGRRHLA